MSVLTDIQVLTDTSLIEAKLNIYIRRGTSLIKIYLNNDSYTDDIETLYPDAIIEYVTICINKRGNEGLKQFQQGSRGGTYNNDLPDSVKALLPLPSVKLMG